jgi:hypothetical protein
MSETGNTVEFNSFGYRIWLSPESLLFTSIIRRVVSESLLFLSLAGSLNESFINYSSILWSIRVYSQI